MGRTKDEALMIDHELAETYAEGYIVDIQNQITGRGLLLTGAIQDFNSFLSLPPSSSMMSALWDTAFALLSMLVPALKLGDFIKNAGKRAASALAEAEAYGLAARRADKAVKAATATVLKGATVAEYVDKVKGIAEKGEKLTDDKEELGEHAAWKLIDDLIDQLDEATTMWKNAVKAEVTEWINRVDDLPPRGGTLESMVRELLPPLPATFSKAERSEIRKLYLFLLIVQHCKQKVRWKTFVRKRGGSEVSRDTKLEGLNDTQRTQIIEWFGPGTKRGKYFREPMFINIGMFLGMLKLPEDVTVDYMEVGNRV